MDKCQYPYPFYLKTVQTWITEHPNNIERHMKIYDNQIYNNRIKQSQNFLMH